MGHDIERGHFRSRSLDHFELQSCDTHVGKTPCRVGGPAEIVNAYPNRSIYACSNNETNNIPWGPPR